MKVDLWERFRSRVTRQAPVETSGMFVLTFKKPTEDCRHVGRQLQRALEPGAAGADDFALEFVPKSEWQAMLDAHEFEKFRRFLAADPIAAENPHCAVKAGGLVLCLALVPHKPTVIADRVVRILRRSADQCSGTRPATLWLHFIGIAESEFVSLAKFSSDGRGAGLNAIVANALHPQASTSDRTHVERIRFSAVPNSLTRQMAFGPTLLLGESVSVGGPSYDVPNPFCRFERSATGAGE
jgi:hypothetical protein